MRSLDVQLQEAIRAACVRRTELAKLGPAAEAFVEVLNRAIHSTAPGLEYRITQLKKWTEHDPGLYFIDCEGYAIRRGDWLQFKNDPNGNHEIAESFRLDVNGLAQVWRESAEAWNCCELYRIIPTPPAERHTATKELAQFCATPGLMDGEMMFTPLASKGSSVIPRVEAVQRQLRILGRHIDALEEASS